GQLDTAAVSFRYGSNDGEAEPGASLVGPGGHETPEEALLHPLRHLSGVADLQDCPTALGAQRHIDGAFLIRVEEGVIEQVAHGAREPQGVASDAESAAGP